MHRLSIFISKKSWTQLYYEHYDIRIKEEIEARKRHRERFSEEEIWYILYSLLNAIRMFEKFSIASGDLKTERVLLNDKGHLKVINKLSFPEENAHIFGVRRFYGSYKFIKHLRNFGLCDKG